MGYYVHINVCFADDDREALVKMAKKHLPACEAESALFLQDLIDRPSTTGAKGSLVTWGIIGNRTDEDEFVKALSPFWTDVLCGSDKRIMIFVERQESCRSIAIEIFLQFNQLKIKKHDCPFAWMQM